MRLLLLLTSATLLILPALQPPTTATLNTTTQTISKKADGPVQNCPEVDQLRKNVFQLNDENQLLKKKIAELEKELLTNKIQEQLEKEEQRGEALQSHQFDIAEKESALAAHLDQINQQLNPEATERTTAGVGSVHPEDLREEVRIPLVREKIRIQAQLELLKQDQRRTQASLATTDAAIEHLKQRLAEAR